MNRMYTYQTKQIIHAPIDRVWEFFSDPQNLNVMTPPEMHFRIETPTPPIMYSGMIVAYTIRLSALLKMRWVTEIRHVQPKRYFVDEQRFGPYRFWYHEHHFESVPEGVAMTDTVYYIIGFGWIGQLLHRIWIRNKLEQIFSYRHQTIQRIFHEN